jgi:hypothetical protein
MARDLLSRLYQASTLLRPIRKSPIDMVYARITWLTCAAALVITLACSTLSAFAQVEARHALVIGNATYKSSPLANPVNDARLMETALKASGFQVVKAENVNLRDMRRVVRDFGDRLKASGGVGLFYFAGHGVQVRGENYLISVDSDIRNEDEVADDSLNAQLVLEKMRSAGNRMNLVILDACRNNPFVVKSRAASTGLATMNAPSGSLVAFSTSPGGVSSDGAGANGLYTRHLARILRQPGLPVEEVFKQVRSAVRRDSHEQQTPWENTALEGQFYFSLAAPQAAARPTAPAPTAGPSTQLAPSESAEIAFWDSVKSSGSQRELQAYLSRFPNGLFADLAKSRLTDLERARPAPPVAALARPAQAPTVQAAAPATAAVSPPVDATGLFAVWERNMGRLEVKELLTGKTELIELAVSSRTPDAVTYNSGDSIGANGEVRTVRVGPYVGTVRSGRLWRFPLQPASQGSAQMGFEGSRGVGEFQWRVVKQDAEGTHLEVRVQLPGASGLGDLQRWGVWSLQFRSGVPIPVSSKLDASIMGFAPNPDKYSTRWLAVK